MAIRSHRVFFYQKADRKVIQRIGTIFLYHGISATLSTLLRSPLFTCPFLNFTLCINLYLHGYFIDIQLVCIGFTILFPAEYSNRNCTVSVSIRCGKTINNLVKFVVPDLSRHLSLPIFIWDILKLYSMRTLMKQLPLDV